MIPRLAMVLALALCMWGRLLGMERALALVRSENRNATWAADLSNRDLDKRNEQLLAAVEDVERFLRSRIFWSDYLQQISPTILAVATLLVLVSVCLLASVELLRRRSERLRGITPT